MKMDSTRNYRHLISKFLCISNSIRCLMSSNLPEKTGRNGAKTVSYSKLLLISRLIYFCRLTRNEAFAVDSSSLKGIIKEYGDYTFPLTSKVYF